MIHNNDHKWGIVPELTANKARFNRNTVNGAWEVRSTSKLWPKCWNYATAQCLVDIISH